MIFIKHRRPSRCRFMPAAMALGYALVASNVQANDLNVNDLSDSSLPADSRCSLREAIANANTNADASGGDCATGGGADSIRFSVSGTILLNTPLVVSDVAGMSLDGNGQKIVLSGNNVVRVLKVDPSASLTVLNLTIANGYSQSSGIAGSAGGAGIFNDRGMLSVVNCTFSGNVSSGAGNGGAIANTADNSTYPPTGGQLTVSNSTFIDNRAYIGGAINNGFGGNLTVKDSTLIANQAVTPPCSGICTLSLGFGGGIVNNGGASFKLYNSIIGDNIPSDIYGVVNNASYNLVGNPIEFFSIELVNGSNGNVVGTNVNTAVSATLADNGGPTPTLALLPGSPAIDAVPLANCSAIDQRGVTRPQGSGCDIGAYETPITADLAVTGVATPNPVVARDSLTWTFTVTNNGTANATGTALVANLPTSGLTGISASASQGNCGAPTSGKITCNLGSLTNGATATVAIKGITAVAGILTNKADVKADQVDPQPANNSTIQTVTVQSLLCKGLVPTIVGTPGNDTLIGTKRRDVIHGLGGNDTISGGADNDTICGGEGQDALKGDAGNDYLNGDAGIDNCNGGTGTDSAVNCEGTTSVP